MKQMTLMCKSHSDLLKCNGYRQRMCNSCPKRDVIFLHYCDACGAVLDEDNPIYEHDGNELCGVCDTNMKGVKKHGNPGIDHR